MSSPEQLAANQANALQSTGPKTAAGKDRGTALASPEHDLNSISLGEAVTRQMRQFHLVAGDRLDLEIVPDGIFLRAHSRSRRDTCSLMGDPDARQDRAQLLPSEGRAC